MAKSILFRNATLLTYDPTTQSPKPLHNHSLLITNSRIAAIAPTISPPNPSETETLDATGQILTPGFINTHTHTWQTCFRSAGPDQTLCDYFAKFSPWAPVTRVLGEEEVFVSALQGYLEGLNAGTTTSVEHAHAGWSRGVVEGSCEAAWKSGARVWWCQSVEEREGVGRGEVREVMEKVRDRNEGNDALVKLGYAWDGFAAIAQDGEKMKEEKEMIRDLKIEAITLHHVTGPWKIFPPDIIPLAAQPPATLQSLNIPIIYSHAPFATAHDIATLKAHNWNISITPESEYHYGHGQATSARALSHASLGTDTPFTFAADLMTQARLFLQHVRATSYQKVLDGDRIPRRPPMSVADAFLLMTRQGGLALRRADLGVLEVGAKADINVFDTGAPNMSGAFADPVAAVVLHANAGDIWGVVVDGEWRKREGVLVGGVWEGLRERFEGVARKVQGALREMEDKKEGESGEEARGPFGGAMEWGEPEVFTTKRE